MPPCLLSKPVPPESVFPADSAMLGKLGGSLDLPGKHEKQRQVPKCLTVKGGLFPGARVSCNALDETRDLRCRECSAN